MDRLVDLSGADCLNIIYFLSQLPVFRKPSPALVECKSG